MKLFDTIDFDQRNRVVSLSIEYYDIIRRLHSARIIPVNHVIENAFEQFYTPI